MTQPAVPFYILCGSLGAGKTTLLMRLLDYWKRLGIRAGVLMNEAGHFPYREHPRQFAAEVDGFISFWRDFRK